MIVLQTSHATLRCSSSYLMRMSRFKMDRFYSETWVTVTLQSNSINHYAIRKHYICSCNYFISVYFISNTLSLIEENSDGSSPALLNQQRIRVSFNRFPQSAVISDSSDMHVYYVIVHRNVPTGTVWHVSRMFSLLGLFCRCHFRCAQKPGTLNNVVNYYIFGWPQKLI